MLETQNCTNFIAKLEVCCQKILGTRPRTTLRDVGNTRTITLDIRLNSSLHLKIFLLT